MHPDLASKVEAEVVLVIAGFIQEVQYPILLANIVLFKKKSGQIRVCNDFRDFNNACPKNDFPFQNMELLIDVTTGYEALSFYGWIPSTLFFRSFNLDFGSIGRTHPF